MISNQNTIQYYQNLIRQIDMNQIVFYNQKVTPSKVICIGRNYVEHIEELGNEISSNMVIFNKPNSAISNELKYFDAKCRFEGELCLLIQDNKIAGLGVGLDLTHADIQNDLKARKLPWERAKAFDGSAVLSEFIPFDGEIKDVSFELFINDKLTQKANYDLMIYKPSEMIDEISSFISFENNDIIMTGTPKGVGTYKSGDIFMIRLYGKGKLLLEQEWLAK